MSAAPPARYHGRPIALLTQHGKERVIAPLFRRALGARVERVAGYDTDRLGSFTREIPRPGTQREAARRKARLGMELAGLTCGLASEGAFGPDPLSGLFAWNVEIVLLVDEREQVEVCGMAQGPARHRHRIVDTLEALDAFAHEAGFPRHHLVLRPEREDDPRLRKGLAEPEALQEGFHWAQAQSATGRVFVENDLRAYANPTRMRTIRAATEDLIRRLRSPCPACAAPGYGVIERVAGLPCGDCGAPTREARAERYGCARCRHEEVRERSDRRRADPERCDECNP